MCGNELPDGMRKNEKFPEAIITPSTKAAQGEHDESVPPSELYKRGVIDPELYKELASISMRLYQRGVSRAADHGMIFVDTKYEFGISNGKIMIMGKIQSFQTPMVDQHKSQRNRIIRTIFHCQIGHQCK